MVPDLFIRFSLVCICYSFIVPPKTVSSTKSDEDEWLRKYGANQSSSGKWQELLDLQDDIPALQVLSTQCHQKAFNLSKVRVTEAYVSDWLLTFPHNKVEPIRATMVMYTIEERFAPDQKIPYYYFTKGTRPDCVLYVQETKMEFRFWKEICGIVLPKTGVSDDSQEYNENDVVVDDSYLNF